MLFYQSAATSNIVYDAQCFVNAGTKSLNRLFFSLGINKYSGQSECTVIVS